MRKGVKLVIRLLLMEFVLNVMFLVQNANTRQALAQLVSLICSYSTALVSSSAQISMNLISLDSVS